jgi:NAD+ kinase
MTSNPPLSNGPRPDQIRTVGLVAAYSKQEAQELGHEVTAFLQQREVKVVPEHDLPASARMIVDAIIVLGGDGLMMRAAKAYPDTPLLGINFGNVGFLAHVERHNWRDALDTVLRGDFVIEESSTLDATLDTSEGLVHQGWAINDVVIRSGVRMIEIEVYVDGYFVNTYPGDGMIVATSRGSTAYCMAAGGPILTAGVRGFSIVPISCHSPIRTPLVVAESETIDLVFNSRYDASLILDGRVTSELTVGDVVSVRRGDHQCRLISVPNTNFYEAFRSKFNFRIRPDAAPSRRTDDRASNRRAALDRE